MHNFFDQDAKAVKDSPLNKRCQNNLYSDIYIQEKKKLYFNTYLTWHTKINTKSEFPLWLSSNEPN